MGKHKILSFFYEIQKKIHQKSHYRKRKVVSKVKESPGEEKSHRNTK